MRNKNDTRMEKYDRAWLQEWTVLRTEEGTDTTRIYVIESGERMSKEERDNRKAQAKGEEFGNWNEYHSWDAKPDKHDDTDQEASLEQRINEQSHFMFVTPPPPGLFRHREQQNKK